MFDEKSEPADFCVLNNAPGSRLSQFERLTLTGGLELERALAWISRQLTSFTYTHRAESFQAQEFFDAAAFYSKGAASWLSQPTMFFAPPESPPVVEEVAVHGLQDGEIVDVRFPSCHRPLYEPYREEAQRYPENQIVHTRIWRHREGNRPTIVAVHGWTMGDQRINSLAFMPGLFYRLGFDVALVELPFHGRRKPALAGDLNGFLFPSLHLGRTNESMGQAISDLRSLKLYLEQRGSTAVGCIGMSLGAYLGALWGTLDELAFCVPIVPMVSMAEVAWEVITREPSFEPLLRSGVTLDTLEGAYRVHCPLSYPPQTKRERVLILAGIGDKIVPPRQPKLLWDHWKRPRLLWFRGGHVAQFKRSQTFSDVLSFFQDLGYGPARE